MGRLLDPGWNFGDAALVIENQGVTPDVPVPVTLADLQGRFGAFRERILRELTAL